MKTNDLKQAFRFLQVPDPTEEDLLKAERMADSIEKTSPARLYFQVCDLTKQDGAPWIEKLDLPLNGRMAASVLEDCEKIVCVASTLGMAFDQNLLAMSHQNIASGLLYDALGSSFVESALDAFEIQIKENMPDWYLTDRFSCGYGDLPLTLQKDLGERLDLYRHLGIVTEDSCMLNPTKSVTAFIGLSRKEQPAKIRGCAFCSLNKNCTYQKEGKTCYA